MVKIRHATLADVTAIHLLAEKIWWPTYTTILEKEQIRFMLDLFYAKEKLRKQISSGGQSFLLLLENELPVAFAAFAANQENQEIMILEKIYCLPQAQGKGYGKELLEFVVTQARIAGKSILQLYVHRENKARNFYEKMNFKVVKEVDRPLGKYLLTDFVMQKEL
ncbi:GNAT family N-acetyltransferase [Mucilaginibacter arboris]|uniref:GNAT family N-acetyltransferase n=1 Tax=Mucilaginibacter arboris TaxID=2682090 RepID=A0A7K1SVJ9_9SPHI|nr:GNAT family N-acetyltransferase [Mucilaginibacter arboris]MVN21351.1 GNAT family N-acetyltransferase [Mucilaginibacter arboris]